MPETLDYSILSVLAVHRPFYIFDLKLGKDNHIIKPLPIGLWMFKPNQVAEVSVCFFKIIFLSD